MVKSGQAYLAIVNTYFLSSFRLLLFIFTNFRGTLEVFVYNLILIQVDDLWGEILVCDYLKKVSDSSR